MKTSAAAAPILALAALLAPSPAVGREAMLGGDDETAGGRRRLGFFKKDPDYYKSIYYRCCSDAGAEGDASLNNPIWRRGDIPDDLDIGPTDYCKCPKRGSERKTWFGFGSQTYYDKWEKSCDEGGTIARKAGIKPE